MQKNLIIVLASVLLSGLTAYGIVKNGSEENFEKTVDPTLYRTVNLAQTDYPDFTYAAETAVDAVVYVAVTVKTHQSAQIDPFFRYFFGDSMPSREQEQRGSGSGVIIREDGYIVTNNHVVENATKVDVTLNNNETYEATVIGTDPATDVALIKIDATGLPVVKFADSDKLRLGEWVIAIGSPYDLRSTITAGIVSAKGRTMAGQRREGELKIESFIQTDAAVNPGNSGGALVNKAGELVGVNTAIISQTGSYTGYSFAVPSNIVSKVVNDLIDFGAVKRAMLGVTMQEISDELMKELKLSSRKGVYVYEVSAGSAADDAGIKKGDVLLSIDGTKVNSMSAVQEKVNSYHPGDKAIVVVERNGSEKELEVTFKGTMDETGKVSADGTTAYYGSKIRKAPQETLDKLGLKNGVEISSVGQGKLREAGAREGFIILYVNDQPVRTPEDVLEITKKSRRSVFVEGVTANGRSSYFGFGKDE